MVARTKFEIRFKQPHMDRGVRMTHIDDNIHYSTVTVPADVKEFKYMYIRLGFDSALEAEELSEQDKTRGKKFA